MQRRKFVVGLGSLAAGGAAAMGTGAFSGEVSERNTIISSAGDDIARTKLVRPQDWPHSQEYTYYKNGHIVFELKKLNSQSVWYFLKLVKLEANLTSNDGKHRYWIKNNFNSDFVDEFGKKNKDGKYRVRWFTSSINGNKPSNNTGTITIPKPGSGNSKDVTIRWTSQGNSVKLAPGDWCSVGVCFNTRGVEGTKGSVQDILDSVEIQAKAADHE